MIAAIKAAHWKRLVITTARAFEKHDLCFEEEQLQCLGKEVRVVIDSEWRKTLKH